MIARLPRLLIGVAGLTCLAYLALRIRTPATFTRRLNLASLDHDVRSWLPKLPYVPYIRLEIPNTRDFLQLAGDGNAVNVDLYQTTPRQRHLGNDFRRVCADLGYRTLELYGSDGKPRLRCPLPAEADAVTRTLEALLHDLYGVDAGSTLIAAVPSRL